MQKRLLAATAVVMLCAVSPSFAQQNLQDQTLDNQLNRGQGDRAYRNWSYGKSVRESDPIPAQQDKTPQESSGNSASSGNSDTNGNSANTGQVLDNQLNQVPGERPYRNWSYGKSVRESGPIETQPGNANAQEGSSGNSMSKGGADSGNSGNSGNTVSKETLDNQLNQGQGDRAYRHWDYGQSVKQSDPLATQPGSAQQGSSGNSMGNQEGAAGTSNSSQQNDPDAR